MKGELQLRAEKAASNTATARRPIVIEFAGMPKAGKTTTLNNLAAFLRRCGLKVQVVSERAAQCPIRDKHDANFNVWTACSTLLQVLEKTQTPPHDDDPQVLILDRGLFDSICWLRVMEKRNRLLSSEKEALESFLRMPEWLDKISGVILMTATPEDAMTREQGLLPVKGREGSIMNKKILAKMSGAISEAVVDLKDDFEIRCIDTSSKDFSKSPKKVAFEAAQIAIGIIERELEERILCIERDRVVGSFSSYSAIGSKDASELIDIFKNEGKFIPRQHAEDDSNLIQLIPVVVVRGVGGKILRLRRKETNKDNVLHEKIVIWAGGHVREEDSYSGDTVRNCVLRELSEELRLRVESSDLKLLGGVYEFSGESTKKHVAVVYECQIDDQDFSPHLSEAEFFERRGNSLSGKFTKIEDVLSDMNNRNKKKEAEPWSWHILYYLLPGDHHKQPLIFNRKM